MTDTSRLGPSEPATGSGRISLRTLVLIRWVAIAGQALALLTVHYGIGFHLPLLPALAVVAGSALLNLFIADRAPPGGASARRARRRAVPRL